MLPLAYPAGHSQLHLHLHLPPAALQRAAAPGRAYLPSRRGARTFAGARPPGSSAGAAGTETTSTTSGSVLSFLCPLLKLLGVTSLFVGFVGCPTPGLVRLGIAKTGVALCELLSREAILRSSATTLWR